MTVENDDQAVPLSRQRKIIHVDMDAGGLVAPSSAVSPQTSWELLLLAIEAFDDRLVGFTSRSLKLGQATDALFSRWADA